MMNKFGKELGQFIEYNNISIKEFAERLSTTSKNLIDIIKGNIKITQNMIYNISFITDIPVSYIENVEKNYLLEQNIINYLNNKNITIDKFINKFNYKEFSNKYNYTFTDSSDKYWIAKDILKYLRITNPDSLYKKENNIFYKSKNDKPELLALWLERCYKLSKKQNVSEYKKENIDKLVSFIKHEASLDSFNEKELIKEFNNNGIFLVIEDDLSGSKIRGAFKVLNDKPAIYLTRKHKRYADIYFALLHELAHCKSDFNRAKSGSIVSETDSTNLESYEILADKTAYNWMIDDKIYEDIKIRYKEIDNLDVIKSFFVYRLAKDNIINYSSDIYQKYNKVI